MPWKVGAHADCPSSKPFAVVKQGTGELIACHADKPGAMAQMAALYAKEPAMKATGALKAEPMDTGHLDRWLSGAIPRRLLVIPFGGPIPSPHSKAGMDVEGEFFDETSDLIGAYPVLARTRERLVDWHHDASGIPGTGDPIGIMKGAILGRVVLDAEPSSVNLDGIPHAGVWSDFWANAGEKRRALVALLERQGHALYGSSEAVPGGWRKADTGHIDVWPIMRETISTSPANTLAVLPPLKALLSHPQLDGMPVGALKALLLGLGGSDPDLRWPLMNGSDATADLPFTESLAAAKAGRVLSAQNEAALRRALEELGTVLSRLAQAQAIEQEGNNEVATLGTV